MPLIAVEGDNNSHGGGALNAGNSSVYCEGKLIATQTTTASADSICPIPPHCAPSTSSYSSTVFVEGNVVHRIGDSRVCGATTIETGNSSVYAG